MRDLCKMQINHYTNIESMAMILNSKNIRFRAKIKELAEGWGQIVTPLAYRTAGGKQKNNFADIRASSVSFSLFRPRKQNPSNNGWHNWDNSALPLDDNK